MKVIVVGEDLAFLREVALDLALRGHVVATATDSDTLTALIETSEPDIVVFDHVEPIDLYVLNPRGAGYEGPLILLVAADLPPNFIALVQPRETIRKPLPLEQLAYHLQRLAAG